MQPEQLARDSEHSQQVAFFCWLAQNFQRDPRLRFVFAVPNGGERNKIVAARMKAEGARQGVPDVFVPIPAKGYYGLWIEFKRPKLEHQQAGRLSKEQQEWLDFLQSQNYSTFVAYNYLQAANALVEYLYH